MGREASGSQVLWIADNTTGQTSGPCGGTCRQHGPRPISVEQFVTLRFTPPRSRRGRAIPPRLKFGRGRPVRSDAVRLGAQYACLTESTPWTLWETSRNATLLSFLHVYQYIKIPSHSSAKPKFWKFDMPMDTYNESMVIKAGRRSPHSPFPTPNTLPPPPTRHQSQTLQTPRHRYPHRRHPDRRSSQRFAGT